MASVLDNNAIESIASLVAGSGKAGLFVNADSFKCNVNDKLNVSDDFTAALTLRGNGVKLSEIMNATPTNKAKTDRTALYNAFKRAARKVNGSESDYRLSVVKLKAQPADGDKPATPATDVLVAIRVK